MIGLRWGVIGVAVAVLFLLGLLGAVSAEGAPVNAAASPAAAFSCGSFDRWGSASAGTHFSATARLGSSAATLEGSIGDDAFTRVITAPMLVIRDGDTTVRSGSVGEPVGLAGPPGVTMTVPSTPPTAITPNSIVQSLAGKGLPEVVTPLCVTRFADDGHPVVLLGLFTGGAPCCTILHAYPRSGSESSNVTALHAFLFQHGYCRWVSTVAGLAYPAATRAAAKTSAGSSWSSFQMTRIGRSPVWLTYAAWPAYRYGGAPSTPSASLDSRKNRCTDDPCSRCEAVLAELRLEPSGAHEAGLRSASRRSPSIKPSRCAGTLLT